MRGLSKKILISLFTTLVVFITVFATTYAWVGIFTYANSDSFKMNLKVQDLDSNYFLTISSSGKKDDFHSEVSTIELERQIVIKRFGERYANESDTSIESMYRRIKTSPTTPIIDENGNIKQYEKINLESGLYRKIDSNDYYKFDLYLSVDTKEGITPSTTGIKSNVYLANINETLEGIVNDYIFLNGNPYLDSPSESIPSILRNMPDRINVNSKNAARFAIEIYNPIDVEDSYSDEQPLKTLIFQGGSDVPSYDNIENIYDLGGCLPEEQNTALQDLYVIRPLYFGSCNDDLQKAINRNDLILNESNSLIWNKRDHLNNYLGCMDGVQTKLKLTIYFWFEGWDADCLKGINACLTTLNLSFTSGTDD